MKLDLQKDAEKIRKFIEKRIRDYPNYVNQGPGEDEDPIALATIGYYFEQSGYFALVFDTRPTADSDGDWTLHLDSKKNMLSFPKWVAAFDALCDGGSVEVTLPNGKQRTLGESDDNESVHRLFGEMIRDIVIELRAAGAFEKLPLTPKAFLIIEEFDGNWGWPGYEKRKTLGRLRKK
jgi:hypothetical protein